ncbi:MAG: alpha/beta hydrolase [Candidatus Eremiobacteraeota bacterium]|nr:alpha/beta hydrolase [Candidatus Eremiobacteraeota bacterium]
MKRFDPRSLTLALLVGALLPLTGSSAYAQSPKGIKNIVLVHGAFADGSSWSKVIQRLQARGYSVTAVQNPLTSLADDVAATKRALDAQNGRVLLVGHSWGGAVISEAGVHPKVAGLLFVAAGAPNAGQSFAEMSQGYAPPAGGAQIRAFEGYLSLPRAAVLKYFAPDLPRGEAEVVAATQGPLAAAAFATKLTHAAWTSKRSWFIVAKRDQMINPNLERALARKMKATTLELDSSHVAMLSHPDEVATFIAEAASKL